MKRTTLSFLCCLLLLAGGCATSFSAPSVRSEIVRQTGADPQKMLELNVGRMTMSLARRVAGVSGGNLPLSGLTRFELAVYDLPASVVSGAATLDFTTMPVRGWEPTVRYRDGAKSGMVLVRGSGDSIGDVVLLFADERDATFVRLRGTLPKELPAALGEAVRTGRTEDVEAELRELGKP
jgi:hypothetical protein